MEETFVQLLVETARKKSEVFVYQSLLLGATVHFYSKEVRTDIEKLSTYIADHGIIRC